MLDQPKPAVLLLLFGGSHDGLGQALPETPPAARRWKLMHTTAQEKLSNPPLEVLRTHLERALSPQYRDDRNLPCYRLLLPTLQKTAQIHEGEICCEMLPTCQNFQRMAAASRRQADVEES